MAASVSRSSSSTAVTKNCPHRSLAPSSIASTGAISPCPSAAWLMAAIRRLRSRALTALEDRLVGRAVGAEALRQLGEARIGADHRAGAIDGRNRHRGMIEEAHEAHFGGALRIGALVARAADHQRPRGAGHAVGAECQLVIEPHRHGLAAAHAQVDVEHLGLDFAGHRRRSRSIAPRRRRTRCRSASGRPSRSRRGRDRASSPAWR